MSTRHNTAATLTQSLVGRAPELTALRVLVESCPVAALVGDAGIGKSTLVRAAFPEARVVSLAGARDAADIATRTASILGITSISFSDISAALARQRTLLVWEDAQDAAAGATAALLATWRQSIAAARLLLVSRSTLVDLGLPSLVLEPLGVAACRTLVAALDAEGETSLFARIAEIAAGNPLQARRALERAWRAAGAVPGDDDRQTRALAHLAAGDVTATLAAAAGSAPLAETLALLAADDLDRAGARAGAIEDATLARLVGAALAWRRGELREALDEGVALAASREVAGATPLGAAATAIAARAALGLGEVARAEQLLRRAEAALGEAQMPALLPPVEIGFLLLAALRGDWNEARRRAERSAELWPRSPLTAVERWWARGGLGPPPSAELPAATALAQLRASERALADGRCDEANAAARAAERAYRQAGAGYDRALALLARAEALTRLDAGEAADKVAEACATLAESGGYRVIAVALKLIEAHRADRDGDLSAYVAALAHARRLGGADLHGHALAAACARVRLPSSDAPVADGQPLRDRIARLGLLRGADRLCSIAGRTHLVADDEPLPEADLVAVVDEGVVRARGREWPLAPQLVLALEAVAEAGNDGLTLEQLYSTVWDGGEYHALRHRNAVYVALNRLRAALKPMLGADVIQSRAAEYAIAPGVRVAVVREIARLPERASLRDRARAWPAREPRDAAHWSRLHRIPPAQARWELALVAAAEDASSAR
ncbi:MAG TPA: helix-turn-helix domain-containing protein [Polyangia bacterium]|nr:helix-turn-helix domain-containing protein [Polyangia bacterium]